MTYNIVARINGRFVTIATAPDKDTAAKITAEHPGTFAEVAPTRAVRSERFVTDGSEFQPITDWVDEDEEVAQEMYRKSLKPQ